MLCLNMQISCLSCLSFGSGCRRSLSHASRMLAPDGSNDLGGLARSDAVAG
ncbi:MAG: hypothetical protein OXC59_11310 [Acidimicrobiaceae bacterium]|nr:hypothetical protein [Acidimicrobiaceae bacterium]